MRPASSVCCLLILTAAPTVSAWAAEIELHVAPDGRDTWSGRLAAADTDGRDGPVATLEAARNRLRTLRGQGRLSTGATVWIESGVYALAHSLEFSAEDSGTEQGPIVFRAAPGAAVRITGGRTLQGWVLVHEPAALERLPAAARGHVWCCSLRKLGIADYGQLRSRGFTRPSVPAHGELFYRGQPMTLARWPNAGDWTAIGSVPAATARDDGLGGHIGSLEAGFQISDPRPRSWKDWNDVWIHGFWAWDWASSYEKVDMFDRETGLIRTAKPYGTYGFRKGQRIYFLNVLEELDQPGEWYVDHQDGTLYFWPPAALHDGDATFSLLESPLVTLRDAAYITLRGVSLEVTRGDAVQVRGGTHVTLAGCRLSQIGGNGVVVRDGHAHRVVDCDVEQTGDGGVLLSGGDRQRLEPGGHVVENCHFQFQGRWSRCYVPAIKLDGVGLRAAHNLIHDHPHCAILFSGNEHSIEYNEIHHVALETGDVGAIYTGRDWTFRGNRIRYNYIHHTGGVGMGSMGVYLDDCVSGVEVYGNIFQQVTRAVFLGGGRDHHVNNNVFVDCHPAIRLDGRGLDPSPTWRQMVDEFMAQQLRAVPADLYRQRYPDLAALDAFYSSGQGVPPENNRAERNICVRGEWVEVTWHARPKDLLLKDNYVGDPGFVSADMQRPSDFQVPPDSPALRAGFHNLPLDQIGLQDDELRRGIPRDR